MADQIAINVKVVDDEVGPKLRQVRKEIQSTIAAGEKASKGGAFAAPNIEALEQLKANLRGALGAAGRGVREGGGGEGGAANGLREAFHVLHPVLEEAGLGLSNLRAFAGAASAGLLGLSAALTGSVLIGLAKLGEQVKKTKEQIDQVYGPKEAAAAAERIKQLAREQGTSPEAILSSAAQIRDTQRLRGGVALPGDQRPEREAAALQQLARIHGSTQEEAAKAATDLFGSFRKQALAGEAPRLTNETLEALPRGLRNELSSLLGAGPDAARLQRQIQGGREISFDDITRRLDLRAPAIHKKFTELPPEKRTASEAFTGAAEAAKVRAGEVGAPIDTLGVRVGDAAKKLVETGPEAPATFLLDVLDPTRKRLPDALRAIAPPSASAPGPATPLPFAAALAARGPLPTGTPVNAAPVDTTPLKTGVNDAGSALEGFATRVQTIQLPTQVPATGTGEAGGATEASAPGHWRGGIIGSFARGGALRRATGGMIRGPGTGTSDSIIARLDTGGMIRVSNGEGIVTAKAMSRLGMSGLDAINNGYASGGVPLPSAAAAAIGSAAKGDSGGVSGRPLEIHVHAGDGSSKVFAGGTVPHSVADRLARESALYRLASGGIRSAAQS